MSQFDHNAWPLPDLRTSEQRGRQLYHRALGLQKGDADEKEFKEYRDSLVMFSLYELPVLLDAARAVLSSSGDQAVSK